VREALREIHAKYPFMAYGTDWLGIRSHSHRDLLHWAVRSSREQSVVVAAGMIACGQVVVLALVCGPIRGFHSSGD